MQFNTEEILNHMKPTLLGFGAMRLPTDVTECTKMFAAYLESGGNYIDTAYVYGGSEEMLKKALTTKHSRDSYLLADKMPPWSVKSKKDCDKIFSESLKRCGVGYFDYYLVHSLSAGNEKSALSAGIYEWAQEMKQKGLVRNVGFSFHDSIDLLDELLVNHPEMDFVMLQLNYADILRGPAGAFHEVALRHKKMLFAMEPIKGGLLASLPKEAEALLKAARPNDSIASWAMRYAASLEGVQSVLSGMSSLAQVEDNIRTFKNFELMTSKEYELLEQVMLILAKESTIQCTGCKYCLDDCPQNIKIDNCISIYNDVKKGAAKWNQSSLYGAIPKSQQASACTSCGLCVPRCPQAIDIPAALKTVAAEF